MIRYGKVLLICLLCVTCLCACSIRKYEAGETTAQTTEDVTAEESESATAAQTTEDVTAEESESATTVLQRFTDDELINMASDYYAALHDGVRPPRVTIENDDGTVVDLHLYEDNGDAVATWDWYYINRTTGEGYDFLGNEVDLKTPIQE